MPFNDLEKTRQRYTHCCRREHRITVPPVIHQHVLWQMWRTAWFFFFVQRQPSSEVLRMCCLLLVHGRPAGASTIPIPFASVHVAPVTSLRSTRPRHWFTLCPWLLVTVAGRRPMSCGPMARVWLSGRESICWIYYRAVQGRMFQGHQRRRACSFSTQGALRSALSRKAGCTCVLWTVVSWWSTSVIDGRRSHMMKDEKLLLGFTYGQRTWL